MPGPSFPLPDVEAAARRMSAAHPVGSRSARLWLLGLHHGSPRMAGVLAELLDDLAPRRLLIELPSPLQDHLDALTYGEGEAPAEVRMTCTPRGGRKAPQIVQVALAPWSAELMALRWARARGVPVSAIDLPPFFEFVDPGPVPIPALRVDPLHRLSECLRCPVPDLWERLVEQAPPYTDAEQLRQRALGLGWALRYGRDTAPDPRVLVRETAMRAAIETAAAGLAEDDAAVWIGGALHAPGLLAPSPDDPWARLDAPTLRLPEVTIARGGSGAFRP